MKRLVLAIIIVIVVAVGFATAKPYHISGDCMEPAIKDGSFHFVNRISPYLRQYQRGDIIAFEHEGLMWIARVMALGTDTIEIVENKIIVNGLTTKDNIERNWSGWELGKFAINTPFQIPENHIFVLSDNLCAQHDDSRVFGPIPNKSIIGFVW